MKQEYLKTYLIIINIITFATYALDKAKAKHGKWRISEKKLLILAFMGGSLGAFLGMHIFKHKVAKGHEVFTIGVPVALVVWGYVVARVFKLV